MNDQKPLLAPRSTSSTGARFAREGGMNRFTARTAHVVAVTQVAPQIVRVTVTGPDFADFTSTGPADHVKLFLPDPATGELVAPTPVGPGESGIVRPDRASIARDFTPLPRLGVDGEVLVDLDFFTHPDPGPASGWAMRAAIGDEVVVVGPRGSRRAPQAAARIVLLADETSLPSVSRWVRDVPAGTVVDVIAAVRGGGTADAAWVADYVGSGAGVEVRLHTIAEPDNWLAALETLDAIDENTFVWAAGEASALVAVRRHLRRTLGLPAEQAVVSGYWRHGVVAFDHHAPIDPTDPD